MTSTDGYPMWDEEPRDAHIPPPFEELPCRRCYGLGDDPDHPGSDCLECDGWGSVLV